MPRISAPMCLVRGTTSRRVLAAVLGDAELMAATGRNGGIRYGGCLAAPPDPEGREYRLVLTLVFSYVFRLDELLA